MKIKLLTGVMFGSKIRPAGTVLDVDAQLGEELISTGQGEKNYDTAPKRKKKANV